MKKTFGLIGKDLSHSFSKRYFEDKFIHEEIAGAAFENFSLPSIDAFPSVLQKHPDLSGLSVTLPFKESIIPYLDELSDEAKTIGAVNSVSFRHGRSKGYNTDVFGFQQSLQPMLEAQHRNALIFGNGGASRAVQHALKSLGIAFRIVSRKPGNGTLTYDDLTEKMIAESFLLINTTPVGMFPQVEEQLPLPYEAITSRHLLFDLIYNPAETIFLRKGKERGAQARNGYEMLCLQAEKSWEIWNGE